MVPKIPVEVFETLRASGHAPPWNCKLRLRRGRMVYGVTVNAAGEITRVDGRVVYSLSDISFRPGAIEDAVLCPD